MRIRITKEVIAKGRGAVVKRWVLMGTLFFGPIFGLFLINLDDISNHPFWNKALILAAFIIFVGPAWGFLYIGIISEEREDPQNQTIQATLDSAPERDRYLRTSS